MTPPSDPQKALWMLPVYQAALFAALWLAAFAGLGWKRFGLGLGILAASAIAFVALLSALASAEFFPNVRYVRGWAVAAPVLVVLVLDWLHRSESISLKGVAA